MIKAVFIHLGPVRCIARALRVFHFAISHPNPFSHIEENKNAMLAIDKITSTRPTSPSFCVSSKPSKVAEIIPQLFVAS